VLHRFFPQRYFPRIHQRIAKGGYGSHPRNHYSFHNRSSFDITVLPVFIVHKALDHAEMMSIAGLAARYASDQ
jgi:hypothetical protein